MASNSQPENIKGPVINAVAVIVGALITAAATLLVTSATGHLVTPSDTRDFQQIRQDNTQLRNENLGLQQEISGLRQENSSLKQKNASLHDEVAQSGPSPSRQPEASAADSKTEKVDDIVAQLDGCEKSTGAITCVAKLTNAKQDLVVRLYNDWTSIIDSTGNEQKPK